MNTIVNSGAIEGQEFIGRLSVLAFQEFWSVHLAQFLILSSSPIPCRQNIFGKKVSFSVDQMTQEHPSPQMLHRNMYSQMSKISDILIFSLTLQQLSIIDTT
jgi:hypothetical protein